MCRGDKGLAQKRKVCRPFSANCLKSRCRTMCAWVTHGSEKINIESERRTNEKW